MIHVSRDAAAGSPPMFRARALDVFTRVPWWIVPIVWAPILAGLAWSCRAGAAAVGAPAWLWPLLPRAGVALGPALGWASVGLVGWTLAEYLFHRFVFHWVPATPWGERFHFLAHGVHHRWPDDRWRLVMPPVVSLPLGAGFLTLAAQLLGDAAAPWFLGFSGGYVVYDLTHYALHHLGGARRLPRWLVRLRAHHMRHHHLDGAKGYGVTSPLWDHVFGTAPDRAPVAARGARG
jgi:sterol desaturase/sphingolipid hydroxylase (fatty acid hydroxylase superfamily)